MSSTNRVWFGAGQHLVQLEVEAGAEGAVAGVTTESTAKSTLGTSRVPFRYTYLGVLVPYQLSISKAGCTRVCGRAFVQQRHHAVVVVRPQVVMAVLGGEAPVVHGLDLGHRGRPVCRCARRRCRRRSGRWRRRRVLADAHGVGIGGHGGIGRGGRHQHAVDVEVECPEPSTTPAMWYQMPVVRYGRIRRGAVHVEAEAVRAGLRRKYQPLPVVSPLERMKALVPMAEKSGLTQKDEGALRPASRAALSLPWPPRRW